MDPLERWSEMKFGLTFEMTNMFARTEFIIGNFDSCEEATREAILHAKSTEIKLESLRLEVELRMARNETDKFISSAKPALRALVGVTLPRHASKRTVLAKCSKVKQMMGQMTDEQILGLHIVDES